MIVTVKPNWTVRRVSDRQPVPCDFADTDAYAVTIGLPGSVQRVRRLNFYLELKPDADPDLLAKFPHLIAATPGA